MSNIPKELKFEELPSYKQILNTLSEKNREKHLLLGNGFSMAYDPEIFSYNALYNFIEELKDPVLKKLFDVINTRNFEQVMRQLDNFIEIAEAFKANKSLISKLKKAKEKLQNSLISAISDLHPEHIFEITEEKSKGCFKFLSEYLENKGKVFSTNYDLLLYWVLIRNKSKHAIDGFGRELLNPKETKKGEEQDWSELLWGNNKNNQTIYYAHGALPFFDTGIEVIKEVYTDSNYLLENIKQRLEQQDYPIFVTAGNGKEKLNHIMHNKYLIHCYEQLCNIQGSLISFGFNFGEYDEHIIEAINKAANYGARSGEKLFSIYVGIYSEDDLNHIKNIENKFKCKVNVFNSKTIAIWK